MIFDQLERNKECLTALFFFAQKKLKTGISTVSYYLLIN